MQATKLVYIKKEENATHFVNTETIAVSVFLIGHTIVKSIIHTKIILLCGTYYSIHHVQIYFSLILTFFHN